MMNKLPKPRTINLNNSVCVAQRIKRISAKIVFKSNLLTASERKICPSSLNSILYIFPMLLHYKSISYYFRNLKYVSNIYIIYILNVNIFHCVSHFLLRTCIFRVTLEPQKIFSFEIKIIGLLSLLSVLQRKNLKISLSS